MRHKTKCFVIREAPKGESSKLLTVLTPDLGVITVNAKGARKLSAPYLKCTQLFAFSDMLLHVKNGFYTLSEASLITDFYSLSLDITRYSLACYLADVASAFAVPGDESGRILRLLLNSLYALEKGKTSNTIVKSAFELRLCAECGFYPEIEGCADCGNELLETNSLFNPVEGVAFCRECAHVGGDNYIVTPSVCKAIKHITESELSKFVSFRIGADDERILSVISERFMLVRAERGFKTLSFYKQCEKLP